MTDIPFNIQVVPAEMFHAEQMAPNMRKADALEIWAWSRREPAEALTLAINSSSKCWAVIYDGEVAAMFGVVPGTIVDRTGTPWMLDTELLEKFQFTFLRHCASYVADMAEGFDRLVNYVHGQNDASIRWLRWLGFDLEAAKPGGYSQELFHRFEKRTA